MPGPGNHSPNFKISQTSAPSYGFSKPSSNKNIKLNMAPSPGTYDIPSTIGKSGPRYGIGQRPSKEGSPSTLRNPGPGSYETQNRDNLNMSAGAHYSMGKGDRSVSANKSAAQLPAPGSYDISLIDKQSNPKYGFGSSKRGAGSPEKTKSSLGPGPGSYSLKNLMGSEGKSYSIYNKLDYKSNDKIGGQTPGPGNYTVESG